MWNCKHLWSGIFLKYPLKKICEYAIINNSGYRETFMKEVYPLKHVVTINKANLKKSAEKGGCGKCTSSCQSACKTSCTVANQKCESVK